MRYATLMLAALFCAALSAQYNPTTIALNYAGLDISSTGTNRTSQLIEFAASSGYAAQDEGKLDNVPIGFTFMFFGQNYTTVDISPNAFLSFDDINFASGPIAPNRYADPGVPNNFIACGYNDYGFIGSLPGTARFYTQTLGAAPNREFRVQCVGWEAIVGQDPVNWVCRLFETTNRIEIHCDIGGGGTLSNGRLIAGVENAAGNIAVPCSDGWTQGQKPSNGWRFDPVSGPEIDVQRPAGKAVMHNAQEDLGNPSEANPLNLTYRIANFGTQDLTLGGAVTFTAMSNCTGMVVTQPAMTTIMPGGYTTMDVQITPTSAAMGFFLGRFQIPSNDGNENPFNLLVSGTAATSSQPDIDCPNAPGTILAYDALAAGRLIHDYGRVPIGQPRQYTYTVYNTNAATLVFSNNPPVTVGTGFTVISQLPANIAGYGSAQFTVSFTATMATIWSSINIQSNDPDFEMNWSKIIVGRGVTAQACEIDMRRPAATSIPSGGNDALGTVNAGVQSPFTYTVANTGTAGLNLTGSPLVLLSNLVNCAAVVTTSPSAFIAPSGTTSFTVGVTPGGGAFSYRINVYSDDTDENPYVINASGTGAAASEIDIQRPAGTSIADGGGTTVSGATAGTPSNITFTIVNTGAGTLTLTGPNPVSASNTVNISGSVSITQPASLSLNMGQSTTFSVSFTPMSGGNFSFDLDVLSNDSDEGIYDIAVSGAASVPDIDIARSASIASGGTDTVTGAAAGSATNLTYTISNVGGAALTLTGSNPVSSSAPVNIMGSVGLTQPATLTLAATASTTFGVSFTPAAAGTFSFTLNVASNDPNENPYVINVSGTAVVTAPEIDIQRSAASIANGGTDSLGSGFVGNSTSNITYTILNTGNATLTLSGAPNFVAISGAAGCTANVTTQPSGSVTAGGSSTTLLAITPNALGGPFSFTLTIGSNDANENPYTFSVNGTASNAGMGGGGGGGGGGGCAAGAGSALWLGLILPALLLWRARRGR